VALRRAGMTVGWTTPEPVPPAVMTVEQTTSPTGETRASGLSRSGAEVEIVDALGSLGVIRTGASGALTMRGSFSAPVTATMPGAKPSVARRDSLLLRPVLVVGQAGWESKFVVTALEEVGWRVSAYLQVAPSTAVTQVSEAAVDRAPTTLAATRASRSGSELPRLDTAFFAAVVLLDSGITPAPAELRRFVLSGGGLVLAGSAATPSTRALRDLAPGQATARSPGMAGALGSANPRRGLAARFLVPVSATATTLESRAARPVVIAGRVGSGRVIQLGYEETWRWRMTGIGEEAPDAHRAWWSAVVGAVAHAPPAARPHLPPSALYQRDASDDSAPLAAMIGDLGQPAVSSAGPALGRPNARLIESILFSVFVAGLIGEWLLRRLRGAR
jgi:hypothetical protein